MRSGSRVENRDAGCISPDLCKIAKAGQPPSDADIKHKVPLGFARGRLSTDHRFAMICSGRDGRVRGR